MRRNKKKTTKETKTNPSENTGNGETTKSTQLDFNKNDKIEESEEVPKEDEKLEQKPLSYQTFFEYVKRDNDKVGV